MTTPNEYDPLADSKSPAMSFKDQPLGTVHVIDVTEPCKLVQQRDFDTDEPAYWPAKPGETPNPKMAVVFNGVDENGEPLSLWCPKPSDLLSKMQAAQKAYGKRIGATDTIDRISVRLTDRVPAKNPKFNKSIYAVKVESAGKQSAQGADPLGGGDDPWGSQPATSSAPADDTPPW